MFAAIISFNKNSFFELLKSNYKLSDVFLPEQKPDNDLLDIEESNKLLELIGENDHYEISHIIKARYN